MIVAYFLGKLWWYISRSYYAGLRGHVRPKWSDR